MRNFPQGLADFIAAEHDAIAANIFRATIVPGLLQTEAYMRAVFAQYTGLMSRTEAEERLELRLSRQWRAFERPQPLALHVILEESGLYRIVGSQTVHLEQLQHLVRVADQPHITLQILPLKVGAVWPVHAQLPFTILQFAPPRSPMLAREVFNGDSSNSVNDFEVSYLTGAFQTLAELALGPEQSIACVQEVIAEIRKDIAGGTK